jgi:AraC-like DNA-binding protein/ligand-binding sensor protein
MAWDGAPAMRLLPVEERATFARGFKTDLEFFQALLLLINRQCPIKNVDLMWVDEELKPERCGRCRFGTTEALQSIVPAGTDTAADPSPQFCLLVNDFGRRDEESCAVSDRAAEKRAQETGKPQIYTCHAGLLDIAVPVICGKEYIATLFSGQVLSEAASADGLAEIKRRVSRLKYVDSSELERAYWQLSSVTQQEVDDTVRILVAFAAHLATSWKRLSLAIKSERLRSREANLARKEFVHIILEGNLGERQNLQRMIKQLRLRQPPNRALVINIETDSGKASTYDRELILVEHAIEEVAEGTGISAHLRNRGICFLYADSGRGAGVEGFARRLRDRLARRTTARVRIGAGSRKNDMAGLRDSYFEACMALAGSDGSVAVYSETRDSYDNNWTQVDVVCDYIRHGRPKEAKIALLSIPPMLSRGGEAESGTNSLAAQREFLTSALEAFRLAACETDRNVKAIDGIWTESVRGVEVAMGHFELQLAFLRSAELLIEGVFGFEGGRHEKLVRQACFVIDSMLLQNSGLEISRALVAGQLGVSTGHLSRIFRDVCSTTFEDYLIDRRIGAAKRDLLDPMRNITEVARRCGFSSSSYFSRVFRKVVGCSPREYLGSPSPANVEAVPGKESI